ncbi:MAG: FKBP-type peptidyl-prolyl cis-trans isomerase [Desulfobacteraceae bacterium]|nr:FKBP-type peptidyl-prolyl cis-trans isomerase [Desulfobacteraceae bacterium]
MDNGDVFDSSEGRRPMELQMGAGAVIPGFEPR